MSVASLCGVMVAVPGGRDASAGSRAEKPRQCFPRGAETLLESQDAHVYRVRRDGALRVYACHFEARVPRQLGDQVFDLVHRPPAMRLSGRLLASVHDVSGPGDNQFDVTYVVVTDLVDQRVLGGSLAGARR